MAASPMATQPSPAEGVVHAESAGATDSEPAAPLSNIRLEALGIGKVASATGQHHQS